MYDQRTYKVILLIIMYEKLCIHINTARVRYFVIIRKTKQADRKTLNQRHTHFKIRLLIRDNCLSVIPFTAKKRFARKINDLSTFSLFSSYRRYIYNAHVQRKNNLYTTFTGQQKHYKTYYPRKNKIHLGKYRIGFHTLYFI